MYNLEYIFYHLTILSIDSVHVEPVVISIENNMLVDIASNDIVFKSIRVPKSNKSCGWFIF